MRHFRVCFCLFLAIAALGLSTYPPREAGAVGVKFTSCVSGGIMAPWLADKIEDKLKKLLKKIPGLGKYFGKSIGEDVPVHDGSFISTWTNKETRNDILARCVGREIFNKMSKGIVDNARTAGRNGGPAFVRNWRNFQTDAQYRGENVFRAVLSNTKLCNDIDKNIKKLFGVTSKTSLPANVQTRAGNFDSYQLRANCTLPSNFSIANYQKDFAGNGGWQAFSRLLEPQNNYYGALFGALDEADKQRALEESADTNQVLANKGLTGKSGKDANDSCKVKDANGKCLAYKDIKTPGSIISDSVAATFQQELAWITNVDELSEVISAATEILLKRLLDFSNPNEGDYTVYEEPVISETPNPEPPGGGLSCSEQGLTEKYGGSVSAAISQLFVANPAIANSLDDDEGGPNNTAFMQGVVNTLKANGFTAGRLMHAATGQLSGDKIIVGHDPPDPDGEVYDIVNSTGDGRPFNAPGKVGANCVTHQPWSDLK